MAKRKPATQTKNPAPAPVAVGPGGAAPAPQPRLSEAAVSRKEMLRAAAERKRRRQNLYVAVGGIVVALLVVVGVALYWRSLQPVVGETTFPTQGNTHIPLGSTSPVEYNSTPPTSGPHYENIVAWGKHDETVRYEHLIHNLEDGGVVVYYQCPEGCPELVAELETVLDPYFAAGRHVVLVPNDPTFSIGTSGPLHKDMGAPIVLTAWRKLLTLDAVDAATITTFIERYEGIDHHRG